MTNTFLTFLLGVFVGLISLALVFTVITPTITTMSPYQYTNANGVQYKVYTCIKSQTDITTQYSTTQTNTIRTSYPSFNNETGNYGYFNSTNTHGTFTEKISCHT